MAEGRHVDRVCARSTNFAPSEFADRQLTRHSYRAETDSRYRCGFTLFAGRVSVGL